MSLRSVAFAFAALLALLTACSTGQHAVARHTASRTNPSGRAVHATLVLEPLGLSPDGEERLLVRVAYRDAAYRAVHIPPGGHVDVFADRGNVQWQPRVRFGGPSAIVRLNEAGSLHVRVTSDLPGLPPVLQAASDTRAWRLPPVTASALGPHTVSIGWFPRSDRGSVRIVRREAGRAARTSIVAAVSSTTSDTSVVPGAHYTYEVSRPHADPIDVGVDVPAELAHSSYEVMRGKAMWLAFDDDVVTWNVDAMLSQARRSGIRAIELRLTYGEYAQITPLRKAVVDRFIDGAAAQHIALLSWTVPRATSFEDLAASVASAAYRTPRGHRIGGIAVDLERGADFLGSDPAASTVLGEYIRRLREAVGPRVLLVATVEDPFLERLAQNAIPYAAIAREADVLQPMTYWRMRGAGASLDGMRDELSASYRTLRRLAGPSIPIDIGGQTADLGNRYGAPPPAEVAASVTQARALGALGETFFDWDATSPAQWAALAVVR